MPGSIRIMGEDYSLNSDDDYLDSMGDDFEPHMVELFQSFISSEDVIVDVGANIGLTAILFAKLANKVYAFEPSPSTYQFLQENLSRAQVDNVNAINLGLGELTEQQSITFSKNNRSGGFVSNKIQPKEGHITEKIQIEALDNYFQEYDGQIDFIKIDVEGFESSVIKGGKEILEKYQPVVVLELNHFCLNVLHRITVPDFFDFLRSVFPVLYAIDTDNGSVMDLHNENQAYYVMHAHIVNFRFPNIVAGFNSSIHTRIKDLEKTAQHKNSLTVAESTSTPEITDGKGRLEVTKSPKGVYCSEVLIFNVTVFNESSIPWVIHGDKPVSLCYHWQGLNGQNSVFDGVRSLLEVEKINPEGQISARMKVIAPTEAGEFELVLTMVQEGVCWLENVGFNPYILQLSVE